MIVCIQSVFKQVLFFFLETSFFYLEPSFVTQSLLDGHNMVKPAIDDMHERLFVDVAKEIRIDHFDCFLVEYAIN